MNIHVNYIDKNFAPVKIMVCKCEQCRAIKNKRKNRNFKVKIKRMLNKKRRKNTGTGVVYYWA